MKHASPRGGRQGQSRPRGGSPGARQSLGTQRAGRGWRRSSRPEPPRAAGLGGSGSLAAWRGARSSSRDRARPCGLQPGCRGRGARACGARGRTLRSRAGPDPPLPTLGRHGGPGSWLGRGAARGEVPRRPSWLGWRGGAEVRAPGLPRAQPCNAGSSSRGRSMAFVTLLLRHFPAAVICAKAMKSRQPLPGAWSGILQAGGGGVPWAQGSDLSPQHRPTWAPVFQRDTPPACLPPSLPSLFLPQPLGPQGAAVDLTLQ